ncbi:unnamed protein product [Strongylus vulgaris]|uniref:Uncharacterized protein n=1 Tax=Strongylus vulgaris TaxID=40348 RepID=A0A3P7LY10_STRVU|nr:unnamed protein product [Strongylus vulgaris]
MNHVPSLLSQPEKSIVRRVTRLVKTVVRPDEVTAADLKKPSKWTESYKSLLTIKKALDNRAKQPGARVYDFRMFDLVLGNSKPTRSKDEKEGSVSSNPFLQSIIPPLVEQAYSLIQSFEGKSKEVGDSSNIKFLR